MQANEVKKIPRHWETLIALVSEGTIEHSCTI